MAHHVIEILALQAPKGRAVALIHDVLSEILFRIPLAHVALFEAVKAIIAEAINKLLVGIPVSPSSGLRKDVKSDTFDTATLLFVYEVVFNFVFEFASLLQYLIHLLNSL